MILHMSVVSSLLFPSSSPSVNLILLQSNFFLNVLPCVVAPRRVYCMASKSSPHHVELPDIHSTYFNISTKILIELLQRLAAISDW
jgi:hypothetical protein